MAGIEKSEIKYSHYDYEAFPPIGIDLGTTNSVIACWVNRPNRSGSFAYTLNTLGYQQKDNRIMPSMVYLEDEGSDNSLLVGDLAYKKRFSEPQNIAGAIKRKIGESSRIIPLGPQYFSPVELTAAIIRGLFIDPIATGLVNPAGVVVSVPYYFTQNQNHNTRLAVEQALTNVFNNIPESKRPKLLALIPEPIAAALNYAIDYLDHPVDQTILTFDLGGGTLDITIFRLKITDSEISFEVLATDGSSQFGGEDFDRILQEYVEDLAEISTNGLTEKQIKRQQRIIREAVITAKEELTIKEQTSVLGEYLLPDGQPLNISITRKAFEALLMGKNATKIDYGALTESILDRVLKKAKISRTAVSTILPIGGSSKIPFFQKILKKQFPSTSFLLTDDSLFFAVAKGAALYAAFILDQHSQGRHLNMSKNIKFITRTGHSLGVAKYNGSLSIIIPENSIVPVTAEKVYFPTAYTDNKKVTVRLSDIRVYQGNNACADKNTFIGDIQMPQIYAHNRELDDLPIQIKFMVTVTTVDVLIRIPASTIDQKEIFIKKSIHLEEK